jgi:hypothetical protein
MGSVEVRYNGITVINSTGVDTIQNNGSVVISQIGFRGAAGAGANFADFYITSLDGSAPQNNFLGDIQVDSLFPDAGGALSEFGVAFPSSPSGHFLKVDEVPQDTDTTYIESTGVNQRSLWGVDDLPVITGGSIVFGIQLNTVARKISSGNAVFREVVRVGSTNFFGATFGLAIEYIKHRTVFMQNPQTAGQWVESDVDTLEIGLETL